MSAPETRPYVTITGRIVDGPSYKMLLQTDGGAQFPVPDLGKHGKRGDYITVSGNVRPDGKGGLLLETEEVSTLSAPREHRVKVDIAYESTDPQACDALRRLTRKILDLTTAAEFRNGPLAVEFDDGGLL